MTQVASKRYEILGSSGNRMNVVETGTGPVVVMLHGGAGCWSNFHSQIKILSQKFRVITPDLRGHGASQWVPYSSVDDFYNDFVCLTERLALTEPFHLVAHSFGGYIASRFASEHGEHLLSLSLLNTGGDLPSRTVAFKFLETFCVCADSVRRRYPWLVNTSSSVATCLMRRTFRDWNCWGMFPKIKTQTLVVLGAFDPLIPLNRGRKMAETIPNSHLQVLSLGGHVSMIDKPQFVSLLLLQHIQQAVHRRHDSPPLKTVRSA